MARKENVTYTYTDDLTGDEFLEEELATIAFSYEGRSFKIDLGPNNAAELDEFMQKYIDAATEVKTSANKPSGNTDKKERPGILAWAKERKLVKNDHRGRLPNKVLEAYDAAH